MRHFDNTTKIQDNVLIDKTWEMHKSGNTPEEISLTIKQPVKKIEECIRSCKKLDDMYNAHYIISRKERA